MLKVNGICKRIGSFRLEDISFHLPKGYIMGLIGPNGSGKTSLIHMILGLTYPERGSIQIEGRDFKDYERENKDAIGYILAEQVFDYDLSINRLANYYGSFYSHYEENVFQRYAREFGLDLKQKGKKLSKGEKFKFQYAFALAHHPTLLVLDEPTANFDPEFRSYFLKLMSQFVSDGEHSILISTHLTAELDRLADYITFLHKGKMVFSQDKESIMETYRLVSGEDYKINLIKKEYVVYKEKGIYGTKALVKGDRFKHYTEKYDGQLTLEIPNIEDIMYFTIKGEK